jgi:predicted ATPase
LSIFVEHIGAKGFLSFGPDWPGLDLRDLNILIGPNGSGKSNLIEAIALLKALPDDPGKFLSRGGRVSDWIWKGKPRAQSARLEMRTALPNSAFWGKINPAATTLVHEFALENRDERPYISNERVASGLTDYLPDGAANGGRENLDARLAGLGRSALTRPNGQHADELFSLADRYRSIQIFRGPILLGLDSIKQAQSPSLPVDFLSEYGSNVGLVLNAFSRVPDSRNRLRDALREVTPDFVGLGVQVANNSVLLELDEGLELPIPITRLSDGTVRYLCLLAALLMDPLPPLICIEEPELGLHPDMMVILARLLRKAAEKTQLIVTTHSPTLVDAFTDEPESVVVCERTPGGSSMKRLEKEKLQHWLSDFNTGLGHLWQTGHLGGNRW